MALSVALIFALVLIALTGGSLYTFYWAANDGQMDRLQDGAESIFDNEECVGIVTDAFPDRKGLPQGRPTLMPSAKRNEL